MRVTQRRDFDDSDEMRMLQRRRSVFLSRRLCLCALPAAPQLCVAAGGRTRATQGHGERLCRELEVDTVGQRGGGWVQGGVIELLQTSHLEQLNLGL